MTSHDVVIILGMHRSGTSCLAGSFQSAGLFLGDVNTAAPHNRKGNRENLTIMQLNDQVLANTGHAWNEPPPGDAQWTTADHEQRDAIIDELSERSPWGFKDPRTLFTLTGWRERLPSARLVGTLRHPMKVAASLAKRGGVLHIPPERGIQLWRQYNARLLQLKEQLDFPILDFDSDATTYLQKVSKVAEMLGLANAREADFFDDTLRQSSSRHDAPLDEQTSTIYEALKAACL
mgnify:FL=1